MKPIIIVAAAVACFIASPVHAPSYLPEMSGGCAQYMVEAITDSGFYYVIWQKDKDTLANGQQIRDDTRWWSAGRVRSTIYLKRWRR